MTLIAVSLFQYLLLLEGLLRIFFLFDSNVAARIGRDAFLEPEILICPLSFATPKTSNFFIITLLVKLPQFDPYIFLYDQRMKFLEVDLLLKIKIEQHLH